MTRPRPSCTVAASLFPALVPLLLGGCSVPHDGWVGVGRADDGTLTVFLRTCTASLHGATLSWSQESGGSITEWDIDRKARSLSIQWPLLGPGTDGVTASDPLLELPVTGRLMEISAWTDNNSYYAEGPEGFRVTDIEALQPGTVLKYDGGRAAPHYSVASASDFMAGDCTT